MVFSVLCSFASAQSISDIWINMPDKLVPYLNNTLRAALINDAKTKEHPFVQNLLGDTTNIEKLTDTYLKVNLNHSTQLEIKLLDANTIAVVKSWNYPVSDSELKIFSKDWCVQKACNVDMALQVEKPNTMQESTYDELKRMLSPYFIKLTLSEKENIITVDYTFPLLGKKEEEQVRPIVKTKSLRWQGNHFQ